MERAQEFFLVYTQIEAGTLLTIILLPGHYIPS